MDVQLDHLRVNNRRLSTRREAWRLRRIVDDVFQTSSNYKGFCGTSVCWSICFSTFCTGLCWNAIFQSKCFDVFLHGLVYKHRFLAKLFWPFFCMARLQKRVVLPKVVPRTPRAQKKSPTASWGAYLITTQHYIIEKRSTTPSIAAADANIEHFKGPNLRQTRTNTTRTRPRNAPNMSPARPEHAPNTFWTRLEHSRTRPEHVAARN